MQDFSSANGADSDIQNPGFSSLDGECLDFVGTLH